MSPGFCLDLKTFRAIVEKNLVEDLNLLSKLMSNNYKKIV